VFATPKTKGKAPSNMRSIVPHAEQRLEKDSNTWVMNEDPLGERAGRWGGNSEALTKRGS